MRTHRPNYPLFSAQVSAIVLALGLGLLTAVSRADEPATDTTDVARTEAAFNQAFDEYKEAVREIEQLRTEYQSADEPGRQRINSALTGHVAHAQSLVNTLIETAMEAYRVAPNAKPQITELLVAVARQETIGQPVRGHDDRLHGGGQYERALPIIRLLTEGDADEGQLPIWGFLCALATHNYDLAEQYLKQAEEMNAFQQLVEAEDPASQSAARLVMSLAPRLEDYREMWQRESALRAAEAEADDLPRVLLTTTKGEITLELFENEAPQSVGNFLTLVKSGYYDDTPFHRVLTGFMAQGGDPTGTGTGGPGYSIPCECYDPEARMHFRGSLSMAHSGRDTGGSQFFLTFVPTPHLDGQHTVFGRVIEGIEVLGDLQRRDPDQAHPAEPDRILQAEVLRDRGHGYEFDRLPGR